MQFFFASQALPISAFELIMHPMRTSQWEILFRCCGRDKKDLLNAGRASEALCRT